MAGRQAMRPATFRFDRRWWVAAPVEHVQDVLVDLEHYPHWWPQVMAVAKIDDDTARVLCRSRLPYTLDLVLHAVRREAGLLEVEIHGDLSGSATFELVGDADGTGVSYTQEVSVAHRGLSAAARVLRPLLEWNHDHMMAGCEGGLGARTARADA